MSGLLQLVDVAVKIPNEDAEMFRDRVADLLNRKSRGFPGAQPVSFSKKHHAELQRADYYLCEKTDGIRCLLYLTYFVEPDGSRREACFLIDRKNEYYHIDNPSFHFPMPNQDFTSFHTETLLDGELVLDVYPSRPSVRRYLVFDCLALDGQSMLQKTLDKRIGAVTTRVIGPQRQLFQKYPEEVAEQPFEVAAKDLQKAYGVEMMFRDVLPRLPHGNDGLVFTCRTSEYTVGTDQHIIKWKPPAENTIDFRLQIGEFPRLSGATNGHGPANGDMDDDYDYEACPEMSLLVNHGHGRYERFAGLYVTADEWESMKSLNQMIDARIIECYKDEAQRWRFKREKDGTPRFRDDKLDANHISTVNSVLESIDDAVSEQDLLARSAEVKSAWKRRDQHEMDQRRQWEREEAERRRRAAAQQQQQQQQQQPDDVAN